MKHVKVQVFLSKLDEMLEELNEAEANLKKSIEEAIVVQEEVFFQQLHQVEEHLHQYESKSYKKIC